MAQKNDQTASFMMRFTQKIYEDSDGAAQVQWKGKISHVQGGDYQNFVEASDAIDFIKEKLSTLTQKAAAGKSKAEQESILARSFDIWKKLSSTGAKMAMETIKDPLKGVSQFQEQIQEQMAQVSEDIGSRIEIDEWRGASKSDFKNIMESLDKVTSELSDLHKKVDLLSKKKK